VKATISIPNTAAFSTNAVTKDEVDADLAFSTSDLPNDQYMQTQRQDGLTWWTEGTRGLLKVHVLK